ncbi:uncharacterized protein [Anoplolepis gracilipes]|uniref:uncharacterized protein isoform X2 n=1 Tax=Anoplolepis gracilipes TaxID=354296 RepID=UPI003B9FDB49
MMLKLFNISDSKEAQCFSFTWPGMEIDTNCTIYNEKYPYIPCVEPIYNYTNSPNTTELWKNRNLDNSWISDCGIGSVCVKYTYIYNGVVVNASYFCGKLIEDQAIAVTEGCYVTYAEGYTIEACACQSDNDMPCNLTIRNTCSILITFMATVPLFIYKIFNIP